MARPQVAIIILNWNGLQDTLECLESVNRASFKHLIPQIYVVDNGSSDNSPRIIAKKYPHCHLIVNSKNLGYTGGNNVGIKAALDNHADYVILLNNDTTVSKNCFDSLVETAMDHNFDLASPKIYFYPGNEFHSKSYTKSERGKIIWFAGGRIDWPNVIATHIGVNEYDHGQFDQIVPTEFATGCCLLVKRQVFEAIGFLDTTYIAYYEDNDFCQRAKRRGFHIGFVPNSVVWHKNAGSSGGSGSAAQVKLVNRSRLIFGLRYAPFRAKLALLKQHFFLTRTSS